MSFQPVVVSRTADQSDIAVPGAVRLHCAICRAAVVVELEMMEYVPGRLLMCAQCALPAVMMRGQG